MTQQIGPYGVFNPGAQSIGGGVSNPAAAPSIVTLSAWPMNEGSGLILNDVSGNVNTATISGITAVTWQANAGFPGTTPLWTSLGSALASNGTITNFDGTTPFTVGIWMDPGGTVAGALLSTLNTGIGALTGWEVIYNGTPSTVTFLLINTVTTNWLAVGGGISLTLGNAHYIVVTYDGSKTFAGVKMYVDGVLDTGTSIVGNNLTGSTANGLPVKIASRQDGSSAFFGAMAFDQILSGVWSGTKIAANFALGPAIYTP